MDTRRLPIRVRLALWYSVSFFVVFGFFGIGMFYAMRTGIERDFDRDLRIRLSGLEAFLDEEAGRGIERIQHELREDAELRPGGELLQISNPRGEWIFQSESMRHLGIRPPAKKLRAQARFSTISVGDVPIRLVTAVKTVGDQQYRIQLAQSLEQSSELIRRFGWLLATAIPVLLLVAAVTGYWMARRALQPVITITNDARAIGALDISKRIAAPLANDELGQLSITLNEMMDRLETAFHKIAQFTADASHELRTPIALIRTTAELALNDPVPQAWYEALSSILRESEGTTNLLEDLLVLARADASVRLHLGEFDLAVPIRQAIQQAKVLAENRGVSLYAEVEAGLAVIEGNRELLRRLFLILSDNAVKYTPADGQVTVSLHCEGPMAQVEVRDTGIGISAEDLPHIFERFYRADKVRDRSGGVGLGLSIAEWIVRVHHGTINVSSSVDKGTTVTVSLPVMRKSVSFDSVEMSHTA